MKKQITLEEILDPVGKSLFFSKYWGKKHLILRRNKFKDLYTWEDLSSHVNKYPHIKGLQILDYDDKGDRWCLDKHKALKQPFFKKSKIVDLWWKGKSIVIPFAEYSSKKLVDMCFEFERYFGHGQCNVYASPSKGSKSFPAHCDKTENFLFHQEGKVKWTIYKEFAPDKPKTIIDEFVLDAGDLLYIPQYQFHKVDTVGPRILCSIHFKNKKEQSLDKFKITSIKQNVREKWWNLNPTVTKTKKVVINRRFPMTSQTWKRPYFKHNQK